MGKIYGYCRISTPKQNIERQLRNILAEYPAAVIKQEAYTGTTMHRPEWEKLLKIVKPGDTIVFDSVSRMSRDAEEGCQIYMELYSQNINLVFLKEHHIDTATYRADMEKQLNIATTGDGATDELLQTIAKALNTYIRRLSEKQIRLAFDQAEKEVQDLRQRTKEGIETARQAGKQIGCATGAKLHTKKSDEVKAVIRKHSKDFGGSLSDADCMKLAECARNTYYKYKSELKTEL